LERLLKEGRPKEQTMQEVSATKSIADRFDQLRTSALVDTSSQARAFSDFLGLLSQTGQSGLLSSSNSRSNSSQDLSPYLGAGQQIDTSAGTSTLVQTTPSTTTQPQTATQSPAATTTTTTQSRQSSSDASLASRNTPVTRESFEEAKPLLAKAGLSDREIEELSAKAQAGSLTWGQLVQSLGSHMSGGKQSVKLSNEESLSLQTMFQKLGFSQDAAGKLVQSMSAGQGQNVLAAVMSKLSSMDADSTPGLSKDELSAFFKALRVPQGTADKLTAALGENSTAAQLKNALGNGAAAVQEQFAKTSANDADLAKSLSKIMDKDVAKAARDAESAAGKSGQDSGEPKIAYELKTKDKNDTSFFDQHEKSQQQKSSSDSWRDFLAKVRTDDSAVAQSAASQQAGVKSALQDAGSVRTAAATGLTTQLAAQGKAETTQQAKAYDKVQAPKVLDQVTEAMLKDLGQGRKQLTVTLDPEDLGRVQVMLQVKGKEVNAVIHAENAETANLLSSQMQNIRKSLEDQGLTVQNLDVQTGLASSQQQQQYYSAEEHNQAQERQEMSKLMSQLRLLRTDSSDMAQDVQNTDVQAIFADHSLHLIA
jgi:flagellar hook-length control protein FliK